MESKLKIEPKGSIVSPVDESRPVNTKRFYKMKRFIHLPSEGFLLSLINSMEMGFEDWTEVYQKYPQMFEEPK